jgi:hypothetical protein
LIGSQLLSVKTALLPRRVKTLSYKYQKRPVTFLGAEQRYYYIVMSGHEIKSGQLFIYDTVVFKILRCDVHPERQCSTFVCRWYIIPVPLADLSVSST